MSFIKNLQANINKATQGYFTNWLPDEPISVGDYGDVNGYRFTRDGNIKRFLKDIVVDKDRKKSATFEKKDGVIILSKYSTEAYSDVGKAMFNMQFGSEGSFLYHFQDITHLQFQERRQAFEALGKCIISGAIKWKDDYVLVTEVKQGGKAVILVADSANASMRMECDASESKNNIASAAGKINYSQDSDRILKFELEDRASLLYRVASISEVPPDSGPSNPISQMMVRIREMFSEELPKPETIYLDDYLETEETVEVTFKLPNDSTVTLSQAVESIESFIEKSENKGEVANDIATENVQVGYRQMNG